MKQHISISQLNELSEEGRQRLDIWYHDECDHVCEEIETDIPRHNLPLLSIGQMIEFLDEYGPETIVVNTEERNIIGNDNVLIAWSDRELADALWEAVKEVLTK